jgi:hypothetical protein
MSPSRRVAVVKVDALSGKELHSVVVPMYNQTQVAEEFIRRARREPRLYASTPTSSHAPFHAGGSYAQYGSASR